MDRRAAEGGPGGVPGGVERVTPQTPALGSGGERRGVLGAMQVTPDADMQVRPDADTRKCNPLNQSGSGSIPGTQPLMHPERQAFFLSASSRRAEAAAPPPPRPQATTKLSGPGGLARNRRLGHALQ